MLIGYFITSYPTRAHGIIVVYFDPKCEEIQGKRTASSDPLVGLNQLVANHSSLCPFSISIKDSNPSFDVLTEIEKL